MRDSLTSGSPDNRPDVAKKPAGRKSTLPRSQLVPAQSAVAVELYTTYFMGLNERLRVHFTQLISDVGEN
ncbi:hypothetical protein J6590_063920 [Homalodisca vitripennis]|nr:hypothetical protein J6590_063920 [Homalodisca vitripennis]